MSEETKDKETAQAVTGEPVSADSADAEQTGGKPEETLPADSRDTEPGGDKPERAAEQDEASPAAAAGKPEDRAPPQTPAAPRRGTSPLSWLALFLSLAALAAIGYMIAVSIYVRLHPGSAGVREPVPYGEESTPLL